MELTVKDITKSFGEKEVLKGISFSAESGKAFGLLGRNGAGKTTTIRIIMDVIRSDSGEILFDGKPIDYEKTGLGYLPEERGLYPKKKIIDQLVYFGELKGMDKKDAAAAVDYWLGRLEMTEYRNKKLDTLSKGNQQKIQLITAVMHDPDIVILDEPFSGLDPVNAMRLEDVVKEEMKKGKTVLFSSHQMNYIEEFCDDIGILNDGKMVLQGNLRTIKHNYERNKLVIKGSDTGLIKEKLGNACRDMEDGSVMLVLPSAENKKEAMEYITSNFNVDEIKVFEPSLNDIFVEYAGDKE